MGSQGDVFPYSVPAVGSAGTGYATTINNILTELSARSAGKVPFSALQGGSLVMGNIPITTAKYVQFSEQLITPGASPVGRIEYYNSEFYLVTAAGAVKMTSGGAINVTGVFGISGDFGGVNPAAVRFVDATNKYEFYDDFGGTIWGYVKGRGFDIANSSTGTFRARLLYGSASNADFTLPPLPASSAALYVTTGGSILTGKPSNTKVIDFSNFKTVSGTVNWNSGYPITSGGASSFDVSISPETGWKLTACTARVSRSATAGTARVELFKIANAGAATSIGNATSTATSSEFNLGPSSLSETVGSTASYFIRVTLPATAEPCYWMTYSYQIDP